MSAWGIANVPGEHMTIGIAVVRACLERKHTGETACNFHTTMTARNQRVPLHALVKTRKDGTRELENVHMHFEASVIRDYYENRITTPVCSPGGGVNLCHVNDKTYELGERVVQESLGAIYAHYVWDFLQAEKNFYVEELFFNLVPVTYYYEYKNHWACNLKNEEACLKSRSRTIYGPNERGIYLNPIGVKYTTDEFDCISCDNHVVVPTWHSTPFVIIDD